MTAADPEFPLVSDRQAARERALRVLAVIVGALFLAFGALGAGFVWYDYAAGWVSHTHRVRTALSTVLLDLTEAEHLHAEDEHVMSAMSTDELMEIIQALPPGYRTVFNLFAIEGYPHKDIGEMLGISENTSKSQFMKARAYLRKLLPKEAADIYGNHE